MGVVRVLGAGQDRAEAAASGGVRRAVVPKLVHAFLVEGNAAMAPEDREREAALESRRDAADLEAAADPARESHEPARDVLVFHGAHLAGGRHAPLRMDGLEVRKD